MSHPDVKTGMKNEKVEPDKIYGRWIVIRRESNGLKSRARWLCRCACGNIKIVLGQNLVGRESQSCGCLHKDVQRKRLTTHGLSRSREMSQWKDMIRRCTKSAATGYYRYGGRGIKVVKRWFKFENFISDMGRCPSGFQLDRQDNDGNYTKQNCQWVSRIAQARNTSRNHILVAFGTRMCIAEIVEKYNLNRTSFNRRIKSGWSVEDSITIPTGQRLGRNQHSNKLN